MNNLIQYFTDSMSRDQKLQSWAANKALLDELKKVEMEQRKSMDALFFPDACNGTNKVELGNGYELHSTHGVITSLDSSAYKLLEPEIDQSIKDMCISWEPKLDGRAYKKIPEEKRELLDEAITTKPKAVTLKIVPPKEK